MLNVVVLMGRLTADPELKHTPSGVAVTSFTLAVERSFKGSDGERQTDFINIVAWRGTAEFICKYFSKGQMMAVNGSIQIRRYTDKDGNKRRVFEIVARGVNFAGSKPDSKQQENKQEEIPEPQNKNFDYPGYEEEYEGYYENSLSDDDLPF